MGIGRSILGLKVPDEALTYFLLAEKDLSSPELFVGEVPADADIDDAKIDEAKNYLLAMLLGEMGDCYSQLQSPGKAIEYYKRYLASLTSDGNETDIFDCLVNLAHQYRKLGEEAITYLNQALQVNGVSGLKKAFGYHLLADSRHFGRGIALTKAIELYNLALGTLAAFLTCYMPLGGGSPLYSPYPEHQQANDQVREADWDPFSLLQKEIDGIYTGAVLANLDGESREGHCLQ